MSSVLLPSVAGMFYPEHAGELKQQVDDLLAEASIPDEPPPKALIAPHAGYIYSGPVAASAYRRLLPVADVIQRVIVLAPAHRVPFRGVATTSADFLRTPLGDIPVDRQAVSAALALPEVQEYDRAFEGEHALEVQLPFLQRTLSTFSIVPFIVGQASAEDVSRVLDLLWGGNETLIVISSDLSHFLDYFSAKEKDTHTTLAIESLQPEAIDFDDACGRTPVSGLLLSAREHGLHAKNVDLRNSGDTAGDKSRVVGYGAYVFN